MDGDEEDDNIMDKFMAMMFRKSDVDIKARASIHSLKSQGSFSSNEIEHEKCKDL